MNLPTEKTEVKRTNPSTLLIYAKPKTGKTTVLSELEDNLIINLEKGGTDFISGMIVDLGDIDNPIDKLKKLREVAAEIKTKGRPYKYVSIDTLTEVDACAEWAGTERYMASTQGQKFNRTQALPGKPVNTLAYGNEDYESVHTLAQG